MTSPPLAPMRLKDRYLVSVVITTKNRAALLREAIESVLVVQNQQPSKFAIELIVVDDGSSDETPSVIGAYPTVRALRTSAESGSGMAAARNLGLREATGDFFTLLDDDDLWLPNQIGPQLALFEQRPDLGAVHAQYQLINPDGSFDGGPGPTCAYTTGWIFEELLSYFPQVATVLTRMDVAREAGNFDPRLTGDNDWDWLLRIARRYPIGRVQEPVMLFRQRPSFDETLAWRRYPATGKIFLHHTRLLPLTAQLRLRPILWRHRGWWATSYFLTYAHRHLSQGELRRALKSFYYACRASLPHTLINLPRFLLTTK